MRPNPDDLLARVHREESRSGRGKLKVFFGYAAGVGKTYAMLQAARAQMAAGKEVVVGYVEPHGRAETEALLDGLERLPTREVSYRGVTLREFDLDAALARRPQLLLVDELAHTNAEGLRHAKRWQDVQELLDAGIDVWTTLNVQHVESLNDVIAQITGVVVRETLPDAVLEQADAFELVDITPEELAERLRAGKVYIPQQAERALKSFFHVGNLVALRELSLRQAASRLQRDVDAARQDRAVAAPWLTSERLLVSVGPSPNSARIIRAAKRMAVALGAEWLAVAVNTGARGTGPGVQEQTARNLRLAEQLGAETHMLVGQNVADTLLEFARARNVSKIVVGKTAQPRWRQILFGTIVDQLVARGDEFDVHMVSGEGEPLAPARTVSRQEPWRWTDYAKAMAVVAVCSLVSWAADAITISEANVAMIFLVGVAFVSSWYGRGPSIASTIVSVLIFDFCFVPPRLTFAVGDAEYLLTFGVMLGIGLLISELTSRLRAQLQASQQQEQRTGQLFRMTRQLSELSGTEFLIRTAGRQLSEIFGGESVLFLLEGGSLSLRYGENTSVAGEPVNKVVAEWVTTNGKIAGAGTDTLPNATAIFVPLLGSRRAVGALGVRPEEGGQFLDPEQLRLLETCASLIALSIERDESVLEAYQAQMQIQAEQLRNSLLSSVSHDLRTPLATIAAAADSLLEAATDSDREYLQTIVDESRRLTRLVDNLLDMARLDSGSAVLNCQWHVLEEIVGLALAAVKHELKNHQITVKIPADFPLLMVDGFLFEQVLVNLLENASRYTPPGSKISISARASAKQAEIRVADNGPGLSPGHEAKVFDKFFRGMTAAPDGRRGVGLGLAICRAIVSAHHGDISAINRPDGGVEFLIVLPCEQTPPKIDAESLAISGVA